MAAARPADFDFATAMASAVGRFLAGRDFPILGKDHGEALRPLLVGINHLPEDARRWLYRVGSGREGQPAAVVASLDSEDLARVVLEKYPERRYPGALIGSTPGSAMHLAAALGMPLLPQTLLVPLAHPEADLDDPMADVATARPVAEALLRSNPDLVVHHMADPNNDRLTLAKFSYFRLKRRRLGLAYQSFLRHCVEPGGTLYLIESRHRWPTAEISDRYFFQFGGHYRSPLRRRPRYAYAFGFIDQAARLAGRIPELANLATQTPGLSGLAKWAAGVDRARRLPRFAPQSLQEWFARRGGTTNPHGRPVVIFPDTFNNRLHTDVGVAAVGAIESAGWQVIMPQGHVCCGRPLYDYGFLDAADAYLRRSLDQLGPHIRAGTPIVGLEPSCLAVFKDELAKMLPHDDDARHLAELACHFGEFFANHSIEPPKVAGRVLLWGHCHPKATGGTAADQEVLEAMGLEVEEVSGGCCGLAGSWGFEKGKFDISISCGDQALLPAVREAAPGTVVVANRFSCQTQIDQGTDRQAWHLAQVMAAAREEARLTPETLAPHSTRPAPGLPRRLARSAGVAIGAGLALSRGAAWLARRAGGGPRAS